jgi:putative AlgH/UPF0301 family transcriptional regulator
MRLTFFGSLVTAATGFIIPNKLPIHGKEQSSYVKINRYIPPFGLSKVLLKSSASSNYGKGDTDEHFDDDENDDEDDKVDWRSFRARLVSIYDQDVNTMANDDEVDSNGNAVEDSWIYETGSTIETGSVLLHKIDDTSTDNSGYGLGRQYLHKSAVLILEHEDNEHCVSTKGVILNRPTDLILYDQPPNDYGETEEELLECGFPIWFGGFDWGIHTAEPKFFCLHSIKSATAKDVSREVINGIYFTSIQHAKDLVAEGIAKTNDFWVFSGFIEWEQGDLLKEIEMGNWRTVATDASVVRRGLKILADDEAVDVEYAGVQTWAMLMDMIHQKTEHTNMDANVKKFMHKTMDNFDDKMLKEWAKKYLCFTEAPLFLQDGDKEKEERDNEVEKVIATVTGILMPGTIIRGASTGHPFLFSEQEFHKSLILIVQDDHELSVGLILNHPSRKTFDLSYRDESNFFPTTDSINLPVRFGGSYGGPAPIDDADRNDDKPLFILHNNKELRDAKIGQPVGDNFKNGIWSCSVEQCISAIANRLATPKDFMCVDGFCMWSKYLTESGSVNGGIISEVLKGDFEIVPHSRNDQVWNSLLKQEVLSSDALAHNFDIVESAWQLADFNLGEKQGSNKSISENGQAKLNDEALKRWMMTYLNDS